MKDIYVNISFDDFHPEDGWGNIGDNVMNKLLWLKKEHLDLKYTFFTTPNFQHGYKESTLSKFVKRRLHLLGIKKDFFAFDLHNMGEDYFKITKYGDWTDFIKKNIESNFFEICIHGYTHYTKYIIPSAEFLDFSSRENIKYIKLSEDLFKKAGINYTKAFRVPARGVNKYLDNDLKRLKYKYISLKPNQFSLDFDKNNKVFYIPQNFSIEDRDFSNGIKHINAGNNYLFIKGHLYEKLENGIRDDTIDNLNNFLTYLKGRYNVKLIHINDINNLYLNHKIKNINEI